MDEEVDLAIEKIVGDRGVAGEDDCGEGGGTTDVARGGGRWRMAGDGDGCGGEDGDDGGVAVRRRRRRPEAEAAAA